MKKEQAIAEGILEHIGGKENIRQLAHCMTRVRLKLKDQNKVNIDQLKKVDGVMGVIDDETLQIVVEYRTVNKVSDVLSNMTGLKVGEAAESGDLSFEEKAQLKKQT